MDGCPRTRATLCLHRLPPSVETGHKPRGPTADTADPAGGRVQAASCCPTVHVGLPGSIRSGTLLAYRHQRSSSNRSGHAVRHPRHLPPPTLEVDDSPCVLRSRARSARYLVDGPGWSGAGPAAVGMGVLPPSSNDPRPLCVATRQAGRQVRHGDHRPAPYATSVVRPPALGRGSAPVQEDPQDSFSAPRTGADRLRL